MRNGPVLVELGPRDYPVVRPLFQTLDFNLIIEAVLRGTSPGRVYVAGPRNVPRAALVLTVEGSFLAGVPDDAGQLAGAVSQVLEDSVFAGQTVREDDDQFDLRVDRPEWLTWSDAIFGGRKPIRTERRHYVCRRPADSAPPDLHDGCSIHRVDAAFLERPGLGWTGYAVGKMKAVCWCIADCAVDDACEIGIRTHPDYRRRRLATATVAAALRGLFAEGFTRVGWHCWEHNVGSRRLAERVGGRRLPCGPTCRSRGGV